MLLKLRKNPLGPQTSSLVPNDQRFENSDEHILITSNIRSRIPRLSFTFVLGSGADDLASRSYIAIISIRTLASIIGLT